MVWKTIYRFGKPIYKGVKTMKKLVFLLLFVCLAVPMIALAGPPEEVVGYFNYTPTGCLDESWAGDNFFGRDCADTGEYGFVEGDPTYYGDFIGESTENYMITLYGADHADPYFSPFRMGWYKGIVEFEGTVLGSDEGTMWIQYVGESPGSIFVWSGTWRILGGAEGLEGVHGGGTWASCEPGGDFIVCLEGRVHFDP